METRFLIYSCRKDEIDEIRHIFSDLPDVRLPWVVDSQFYPDSLEVPFVTREADGMVFRGLDTMRDFVSRVKQGQSVAPT